MRHLQRSELRYPGLWRGCVGAWAPCLGPTGLTLRDWSGFAQHAALTNMDAATDWVVNQRHALDFDGVNDVGIIGNYAPLSTSSPFTFSAWIYSGSFASNRYPTIAAFRSNSGVVIFAFSNDGPLRYLGMICGSSNAGWARVRNNLAATTWPNTWRHVAYSYNGSGATTASNFRMWIDGAETSVDAISNAFAAATDQSAIGWDGASAASNMLGAIDDVRLYNRALSSNEIRLLASRRGIAYETFRRRRSVSFASSRRRRLLLLVQE